MDAGNIVYSYTPKTWNQDQFLDLGGFTVVFLNYNKGRFVEKSVQGALEQDFPFLEMYFMDDASTDGSGDIMEKLVRKYQGRHKVTVVRNKKNQHICGQWNIVSKLATGNWFGMFCADDFAKPDRVSNVARIIDATPSLLGLCTGLEDRLPNGEIINNYRNSRVIYENRETDLADILNWRSPIIGASAFWNKRLFHGDFPKAPLDDVFLRCLVYTEGLKTSNPTWGWFPNVVGLTYNKGGLTTEAEVDINGLNYKKAYIAQRGYVKKTACLMAETLNAVEKYLRSKGVTRCVAENLAAKRIDCQIVSDGNFSLAQFMVVSCSTNLTIKTKCHLWYSLGLRMSRKILGENATASIACMFRKIIKK